MKIIFFDFEVFKYNVLFGSLILDDDLSYYQTWDKKEIRDFYEQNKSYLWVGHNNLSYDNAILESIINNEDTYTISKQIINGNKNISYIPPYTLDLMKLLDESYSLKATEGAFGNDIVETPIDFDLDRELTSEEKTQIEKYNRDDLNQTFNNFIALKDQVETRFGILKEFNIDKRYLNSSKARLASKVLNAKRGTFTKEKPALLDDLKLNNEALKEYFLNEKYLTSERLNLNICNLDIKVGSGGIHGALERYKTDEALYFDVSGFYNLTMINKDLLPRSLNEEGKKTYEQLYYKQLELKKTDPQKRKIYKTILLSVFGASLNKYSSFYDSSRGNLVMIVGQLYLVDLLEKLNNKVQLIQVNTDGIIIKAINNTSEDEIIKIVEDWEKRTKYTIKKERIYNLYQRDVNCYMYKDKNNKIVVVGENAVYENWKDVFSRKTWKLKEPPILAYIVVDYFMNGIKPEDTINKYKNELRMFQYICKKDSFDYLEVESIYNNMCFTVDKIQNINRVFASNNNDCTKMIYKVKTDKNGKIKRSKVSSLPDNIFIYNKDINDKKNKQEIIKQIDYDYYLLRGYEKITTFL